MLVRFRIQIVALLFVFSTFALVFIYRMGSARVDRGTEPGMRDLGTYLRAGSNFLQGVDPYTDPAMRLGPSLLPFFGVINLVLPEDLLAIIFQLLAILGILFLVNSITELSFRNHLAMYLAICWFSATRENLVNIQITGLLALLVGCGIRLLKNSRSKVMNLVGCYLFVLASDTKPHIFLLMTIAFLVIEKKAKFIWSIFLLQICSHVFCSLINGHFLTSSWFKTLLGLYDIKSKGKLGESLVFWPFLERFGVIPDVTSLLSIVILLMLLIHLTVSIRQANRVPASYFMMALAFPSIGIFFHYYDLAIAISLLFAYAVRYTNTRVAVFLLPFALVPSGIESPRNMVILVGILSVLRLFQEQFLEVNLNALIGTFVGYLMYSLSLKYLVEDDMMQQFQVTFAAISIIVASLTLKFQNSKTIIPRKME